MTKEVIYKDLNLGDKFNVAFPDNRIPAKSNINKKKTRLGITYTCFKDKRNFIGVLPSVAIIEDALVDPEYADLNLFPVKEGVTPEMIKIYLESDAKYKRIIVTPESFDKIIKAAKNRLPWLYKNFFIYLDEVHCYATESFREDILKPFDHFFKFHNHSVGTATYFPFTDPRLQALQPYEMRYQKKFGKITIVNYHSPRAVLNYILTHPEEFPGRVHIFFNTVTECGEAIRNAGIEEVNIYCRNDERNMMNLDDMKVHFRNQPIQEEYKKFNFYSCRYNDGWNLRDDETATIVLVTDTSIPHSLIGIPYKGFQAVGRLMVQPHKIYHVTNNFGKDGMKSLEEIQTKWHYNAEKHIEYYNQHFKSCAIDKIEDNGLLKKLIEPFASFEGNKAEKNPYKVDQLACAEYCKEHYNSAATIQQTWESLNYYTEFKKFDIEPIKPSKKLVNIYKQVIERIKEYRDNKTEYMFEAVGSTFKKLKVDFKMLFEAVEILGIPEIERLNFDHDAIKARLIETSNMNAETKLLQQLIQEFKIDVRYTTKAIKSRLQELYDQFGILKVDGTKKVATAKQLEDFGFQLKPCKTEDEKGKKCSGYEVISINYRVKVAA